jgi:peptide chain release factor 1
MFEKLQETEKRFEEIEGLMALPETVGNMTLYRQLAVEYAELRELVDVYRSWKARADEVTRTAELLESDEDEEMKALARDELVLLEKERGRFEAALRQKLLSRYEQPAKAVLLEIRAGTGGEEAALFAGDLLAMYMKYAEARRWKTELINESTTGLGGFKEAIVSVGHKDAFARLRYESGVHRVQRVPETEAQGRIHTSTVTVAVLAEAEELEVSVNADDIRIDVFRSSGPGGQHVNTTDSAVRITHLPTGITVTCQDEKSQHKNKAKAMRVLRARLKEKMETEKEQEVSAERKKQVGTGERSERIRTYNFPQGRVTDHRIGLTLYKLQEVLNGDLDDILDPLAAHYQAEALQ